MKSTPNRKTKSRGSFTLVALVVMLLGTLGMMSLVTIMNARVSQVNSLEDRALRKVRQLNGKQMAKAYVYQQIWTSGSGAGETISLPGNWGRIIVPAWSNAAFTTTNQLGTVNPASPSPNAAAYAETIDIAVVGNMDSGTGTWSTTATPLTVRYQLCSRALNLSEYVFESRRHNTARTVSGNLYVYGKSAVWQHTGANNSISFRTEELHVNSDSIQTNFDVKNLAGATIRPSNLPITDLPNWFASPGSTSNPSGTVPIFFNDDWAPFNDSGSFPGMENRVIARNGGSAFTVNAITDGTVSQNGMTSNGAGVITIDLNSLALSDMILADATTINFVGQTTVAEALAVENQTPVTIIHRGGSLSQINLTGSNARPLIVLLGSDGSTAATVSLAGSAEWRLFLLADVQPLNFASGGTSTIRGGLATDDSVVVSSGRLDLYPETANPAAFEDRLWRSFWVEAYLQY